MAKVAGRKVKIYKGTGVGAVLVAGARADSITINNEPIDITDKGDDGWRTLLNDASVRSVEMTVSGLLDGATLIAASLGATAALFDGYEIRIEGIGTAAGSFFFASMEITANHDGAAEFSASIQSSGIITWTAA
ncbi:MAG: phage tail tube protein [Pseudomonadota bacterium]